MAHLFHRHLSFLGQSTVDTQKTKIDRYRELLAQGWSKARIAEAFGVTRQAVDIALRARIPAILRFHATIRDGGRCSHCGEHTKSCKIVDQTKPVTIDNIGLLCSRCSYKRSLALKNSVIVPKKCPLAGCSSDCPRYKTYCSPEHRLEARERRKALTAAKWAVMTEKSCSRCKTVKPVTEFYPVYGKPALSSMCKRCQNKASCISMDRVRKDPNHPKHAEFKARAKANAHAYHVRMMSTPEGREYQRARRAAKYARLKAKNDKIREEKLAEKRARVESPEVQAALDKLKRIL